MSLFNIQKFKILRHPTIENKSGYYYKGEWVEASGSDIEQIEVEGTIQPISSEELQSLEEGFRDKEVYKGFINLTKNLYTVANLDKRDKIEWNGNTYKVIKIWKNSNNLINHYKFYMIRENDR